MTNREPRPAPTRTGSWQAVRRRSFVIRHFKELSVTAALSVMLLLLMIFAPNFFEPQPLLSRLTAAAPRLVLACGVALVIIVRQIDISIGSLFAVCGTCAGLVAAAKLPFSLAFLAAMGVGALGGALNGVLIAALRLPSIVVTLATMV